MAFGLGRLALAPAEFWSMTLRELEAAASVVSEASSPINPISRNTFEELMSVHPDQEGYIQT